jgi:hypothetical protein
MMFCPKSSGHLKTQFGEVRVGDYATCKHVRVAGQNVMRDAEGKLAVEVQWANEATEPYKAQVRVCFFDAQGKREKESYTWDLHAIPPGESQLLWASYTQDAVSYQIDVREAE